MVQMLLLLPYSLVATNTMNKVLLIDADSTIPNIALGKLSTYYKRLQCAVDFRSLHIPYYPNKKRITHMIDTKEYDKVYCSAIFDGSTNYIKGDNIEYGGTGYSLDKSLPQDIESMEVDYSLYPDNDTSYGFITRGCIRNCAFCVVPHKEGRIHQVSTITDIVRHKKVKFLDNNILAFAGHLVILEELITKNIKCQFNQGLDIRLVTADNSKLLSRLHYLGEYTFAFDDWSYLSMVERGMSYLQWAKDWQLKFFCFVSPDMKLENVIRRVEWLRNHKQLPYIMRHISCWDSAYSPFYVDLAAWCNQPNLFKKMDFAVFMKRRHPNNSKRVGCHIHLYKEAQNV